MGYTHYFETNKNPKPISLDELKKKVDNVLNEHKNIIRFECDEAKPALCEVKDGEILIRFNGIGDDGHETFYFDSREVGFNFCKTARKPYDVVVCKVLLYLKQYFGDAIDVRSDGFSNVQPKDSNKYNIGDSVRFDHLDGNWSEAMSHFIDDIYGEEMPNAFIVGDVYGDDGCYFSYKINTELFFVS